MEIQTADSYRFFGSRRSLYALSKDSLLQCSAAFREKVYPMLEQEQNTMHLALKDLPSFCGCVLPEIQDLVEIADAERLLQDYLPGECASCFYFDMERDVLSLNIVFRYEELSFTPTQKPSENNGIKPFYEKLVSGKESRPHGHHLRRGRRRHSEHVQRRSAGPAGRPVTVVGYWVSLVGLLIRFLDNPSVAF